MITVQQILEHKGHQVWTIDADASVLDAIGEMATHDIGALVVMEGADVVGLISERQYARGVALLGRSSRDTRVRDIMRTDIPRVALGTDSDACIALITEYRTRHLPVMTDRELVGLISIGDLVAAIIREQQITIDDLTRYIATG
ncbi:CBS domain-containing protein [Thiohalocapsa marina]|uniref:CBS domain-containing protein n=1 Tax=Thiohalocapsa marina TaxID=424902 RepID=A0A5M8FSA3_9GAMM|nr:CBS domain-containing protein [Thiohalocapsa marina]KAA6186961.1 CBS domain-containing protein [Thiohalocapsa marina]